LHGEGDIVHGDLGPEDFAEIFDLDHVGIRRGWEKFLG
jgi:hypothetical protein